ncbi:MAG: TrkH family potassium uptake protein [Gammaproteobacteria bacterium]|nr:TrkH family potassium uptake protein [Gammaproteobacteria bacterium]
MSGRAADAAVMYAVRPRVIARYLGQIGAVLVLLCAVPLAAGVVYQEFELVRRITLVTALVAALAFLLGRVAAPTDLQRNEAFVITVLTFILAAAMMTWPLMTATDSALDALFEAVSGVTTTGLSMLTDVDSKPRAILLARAWLQWYGGLGIAVLSVAVLAEQRGIEARLLDRGDEESLAVTARTHARRVLQIYVCITLVAAAALWLATGEGYSALSYTFAAVSTGGFATTDRSLAAFTTPWPAVTVTVVTFTCAIGLPLYRRTFVEGRTDLWRDVEVRTLVIVTAAVAAAITVIMLASGLHWRQALQAGLFMGVSAQTTSGFSTLEVGALPSIALGVMLFAMLIGGCTGSTAGGIKTLRLLAMMEIVRHQLRRACAPRRAVLQPHLRGGVIEPGDVVPMLVISTLFITVIGLSWLAFLAYGQPPLPSLFDVVSATSTVGLSAGVTGPDLAAPLKVVLIFDMLAGRVEIFALLVLLYPRTWIGQRRV